MRIGRVGGSSSWELGEGRKKLFRRQDALDLAASSLDPILFVN
jgi:hypothetical protein